MSFDFDVQKKAIQWCDDYGINNGTFDGVHVVSKSDLDTHLNAVPVAPVSEYITLCEAIPIIANHLGWSIVSGKLVDTLGRENVLGLEFEETDSTNVSIRHKDDLVGAIYLSTNPNDGQECWKIGTGKLCYKYNPIASMFNSSEAAVAWVRRNASYIQQGDLEDV